MCNGCGRRVDKHIAHIDHKVPRTKGGQDHFGNLQILCSGCDTLKGNRTMAWLMKTLEERGLMANQSNGLLKASESFELLCWRWLSIRRFGMLLVWREGVIR